MSGRPTASAPQPTAANFGDLLRQLCRRAGMTQRDLAAAVGYSVAMICSLEKGDRLLDVTLVAARFAPALALQDAPALAAHWVAAAASARGQHHAVSATVSRTITVAVEEVDASAPLPAAPLVSELLAACPGVRILATSRQRLRLRQEQRFAVAPLALDDAVELFALCVAAVDPEANLLPTQQTVVAQICRELDCLPLAIELCAAHVHIHPPAALLSRLRDLAWAQEVVGETRWLCDDLDGAEAAYRQARATFDELGLQEGVMLTEHHFGQIARRRGEFAAARKHYRTSLELAHAQGDERMVGRCLAGLGAVAASAGDDVRAATLTAGAWQRFDRFPPYLAPCDEADYRQVRDAVTARLAPGTAAAVWQTGRILAIDRMMEEA